MKAVKYEYSVIRSLEDGSSISWRCSNREDARIHKKELKQAGISAKIVQTIYKQIEQREVR